jgi:hypothetical protein
LAGGVVVCASIAWNAGSSFPKMPSNDIEESEPEAPARRRAAGEDFMNRARAAAHFAIEVWGGADAQEVTIDLTQQGAVGLLVLRGEQRAEVGQLARHRGGVREHLILVVAVTRRDGGVQHLIAATNVDPHVDPKPDLYHEVRRKPLGDGLRGQD